MTDLPSKADFDNIIIIISQSIRPALPVQLLYSPRMGKGLVLAFIRFGWLGLGYIDNSFNTDPLPL